MKTYLNINKTTKIKCCKSKNQNCVNCNKRIGKGRLAITMTNKTDNLTIKKNLWMHINCVEPYFEMIKIEIKKHKRKIARLESYFIAKQI